MSSSDCACEWRHVNDRYDRGDELLREATTEADLDGARTEHAARLAPGRVRAIKVACGVPLHAPQRSAATMTALACRKKISESSVRNLELENAQLVMLGRVA